MRLIDNLRNAEKKGIASVRRQMDRAKDEWSDVERRIRQRMRIYPQKLRKRMGIADEIGAEPGNIPAGAAASAGAGPATKPIISVHGRDVPEHEIENKAS
jgi:hypothetical protein